jgi:hypothetical protein
MTKEVKEILRKELRLLTKAGDVLQYTYDLCSGIEIKGEFSQNELDKLELLTARFARTSDLLIQKTLRTIDELELEPEGTVRDRINKAEKRGIISNSGQLIEIRELRNQIAHDYLPEELNEIFGLVVELTPVLLGSIENIIKYSQKFA